MTEGGKKGIENAFWVPPQLKLGKNMISTSQNVAAGVMGLREFRVLLYLSKEEKQDKM